MVSNDRICHEEIIQRYTIIIHIKKCADNKSRTQLEETKLLYSFTFIFGLVHYSLYIYTKLIQNVTINVDAKHFDRLYVWNYELNEQKNIKSSYNKLLDYHIPTFGILTATAKSYSNTFIKYLPSVVIQHSILYKYQKLIKLQNSPYNILRTDTQFRTKRKLHNHIIT